MHYTTSAHTLGRQQAHAHIKEAEADPVNGEALMPDEPNMLDWVEFSGSQGRCLADLPPYVIMAYVNGYKERMAERPKTSESTGTE